MNHIAAIHTLKSRLGLSDDDYRALLRAVTGQASSKDCTAAQQLQLREHMQRLAEAAGVAKPRVGAAAFAAKRAEASPRERKVWALWNALGRAGRIRNPSAQALGKWVERQTGASALRFCTPAQLDQLIEALKRWEGRA